MDSFKHSLETFGPHVLLLLPPITGKYDADRQYWRQHPKTFSTNIITLHNSVQVNVKFRVWNVFFIHFIFYIFLTRIWLNLSTNLPMFVYIFQAMWRHRPLEEYSVFVGIRAAHTSFSPFTLTSPPPPLRWRHKNNIKMLEFLQFK